MILDDRFEPTFLHKRGGTWLVAGLGTLVVWANDRTCTLTFKRSTPRTREQVAEASTRYEELEQTHGNYDSLIRVYPTRTELMWFKGSLVTEIIEHVITVETLDTLESRNSEGQSSTHLDPETVRGLTRGPRAHV